MTAESSSSSAITGNDSVAIDQVSVRLAEDDILGLHVLALLDGVADTDSDAFLDTASFTMREGVMARLAKAGMPWPPNPDSVTTAKSVAASASATEAVPASHEQQSLTTGNEPATDRVRVESLRRRPSARKAAVAVLAILAVTVIVGGYAGHWEWTGYESNTLWDWLQLLLAPLAINTFVIPKLVGSSRGTRPNWPKPSRPA